MEMGFNVEKSGERSLSLCVATHRSSGIEKMSMPHPFVHSSKSN